MTDTGASKTEAPTSEFDVDVVIVGAGPTGLITANQLGAAGISVLVLEALDELIDYPRGVGIDDESLRTIQATGLIDRVLEHVVPDQQLSYVAADGRTLADFLPATQEFGWPRKNGFIQPLIDRVLFEGLARFDSVEVRFGHEVTSIDSGEDAVRVTVTTAGEESLIRARYLVGADGGRSITRKSMGVDFDGVSVSTRWLVIDVENDPVGSPNAVIYADPKRPIVSIGLPHGVRRFEFLLEDDESTEEAEEGDLAFDLMGELLDDPRGAELIRRRVYTHHARVASSFRAGRVLIGGDAAHLMPVWQGQGFNTGVRDAGNIAWKLAMVIKGQADDRLLDTYDLERRPHSRAMVDLSHAAGRFLGVRNPFVAKARDLTVRAARILPPVRDYFLQMRFKPMPRYTEGAVVFDGKHASPATGMLFPQPDVLAIIDGEQHVLKLDDVIGHRSAMIRWGHSAISAIDAEAHQLMQAIDAAFITVIPDNQRLPTTIAPRETVVLDTTGRLRGWFNQNPPVAIIRPDRILAGTSTVEEASNLVASYASALSVSHPR